MRRTRGTFGPKELVTAPSVGGVLEWTPTRRFSVALQVPAVLVFSAPASYRTSDLSPGLAIVWRL